jgi:hypothetical protein
MFCLGEKDCTKMHFYYNRDEQLMQHHGTAYILLLHIILIEKEETQLVRNVKEEKTSNTTLNLAGNGTKNMSHIQTKGRNQGPMSCLFFEFFLMKDVGIVRYI